MKEMYSPQEVAEILDIHVKTVRRYLRDGTIMGQKIGGSWKIPLDEIQNQVNKRIPSKFNKLDKSIVQGKGKIRRCLIIEIDVASQIEANTYAQSLMEIINSNQYTGCKFQYHLDNNIAKFIINGTREYLDSMLLAIEEVENNEDK